MIRDFVIPPALRDHALSWPRRAGEPVAEARSAATVVLVRDHEGGGAVELFLLRRQTTMAFAAGMCVFPGGGVDPRDADAELPWAGPEPGRWAGWLGCTAVRARELVCAAVRETFEECGVMLAGPDAQRVVDDVSGADWEADRQALLSRDVALSELLRRRGLVLRSDLLRPWAHWTTPEFEPRRYDTRFFLAAVPTGQVARHVEAGEASESGWWRAADVLTATEHERVALLPPTLVTIEEVAAADHVEQLLSADRVVRPVMPWLEADTAAGACMRVDLPG